jgi:diguanylate cyclase (GGDEF)-like protein
MIASIRPYDAVGRYGGEEFLVVIANSDSDAGAERADQIRRAIAGQPFLRDKAAVNVTCSLGVYPPMSTRSRLPGRCSRKPMPRCILPKETAATESKSVSPNGSL